MSDNENLVAAWMRGNNDGDGYAVGSGDQSPEDACEAEGWEILYRRANDSEICLARMPGGTLVGVGYAHGPWAVTL